MAWLRTGGWGPPQARARQQHEWSRMVRIAGGAPAALGAGHAAAIHQAELERVDGGHPSGRGIGAALYAAAWAVRHGAEAARWRRNRSAARRWMVTNGNEWDLLRGVRFTEAFHVARALAGGLRGGAGRRSNQDRQRHPGRCERCGNPALEWVWCTAGTQSPGLGWCSGCISEPQRLLGGAMWALAREDLQQGEFGRASADSRRDLTARAGEDSQAAAQGTTSGRSIQDVDVWPDSMWGTCPLCGRGEAGAEHLIIWCPGVGMAWHRMSGGRLSLVQTIRSEGAPMRRQAAELVHQASFLHGSLMGRTGLDWQQSGHWLLRATQAMLRRRPLANDPAADQVEEEENPDACTPGIAAGGLAVWRSGPVDDCAGCSLAALPAGVRGDNRHRAAGNPRRDPPSVAARTRAVTTRSTDTGALLACLHGRESRGLWPLGGGIRWPAPRTVAAAGANAVWRTERCTQCNGWHARLIAAEHITEGGEITVGSAPHVSGGDRDALGYEVAFDGALRTIRGIRVAGAGAVLWGPIGTGGRELLARTVVALPGVSEVVVAEAYGCSAALALLAQVQASLRSARFIGDNPLVVRHGAAVGRIRQIQAESLMASALALAAANGWALQWTLVGRDSNLAAHGAASDGATWARACSNGELGRAAEYRTEWR